ncbi:MAG: hypothetical protein ACR2IH_10415 [Pyrinomonadaceae bacterium]
MNFQSFSKNAVTVVALLCAFFAAGSDGQVKSRPRPKSPPPPVQQQIVEVRREMPVAARNNLYCAGYVQVAGIDTSRKIMGAVNEQDGNLYSENNVMYLNFGANKGAQVGDVFSVVRPRGQVHSHWSKKDELGFYVQEVGSVEVMRVKPTISVVRVKTSCDNLMMGDLVQPMQVRVSPTFSQRPALDLYGDPSGKAMGRLLMARDNIDLIGRDQIVYIDLGAEDHVQVGDYLTIFRPLGKGNLFINDEDESVPARSEGYQSDHYRGGKFSNQAGRKSGEHARGPVVTTEYAKEFRHVPVRKVVGEMVILNVKERTATAVITRTAQEIHPGDWVEVQ